MIVPSPQGSGLDTRARVEAREALIKVLWAGDARRLPAERELCAAIDACDPRDLWWVCEANSFGPLYLLPTREWVRALTRFITETGARSVLEVGAGDGFLSACIAKALPSITVRASDSHAWRRPDARMSDADRAEFAGVPFAGIRAGAEVERLAAVTAIKRYDPDLVIVSWAPPGSFLERVIRAPSKLILELGVEGDVTGDDERTWRYNKEFLAGPLEDRALCRLDSRPALARHTRATLYYGAAHPDHARE